MSVTRSTEKTKTYPIFGRQSGPNIEKTPEQVPEPRQTHSSVRNTTRNFESMKDTTALFNHGTPKSSKRQIDETDPDHRIPNRPTPKQIRTEPNGIDISVTILDELRAMSQKVNSTLTVTQEIKTEIGLLKTKVGKLEATVDDQSKQIQFLQKENDRLYMAANRQYLFIHGLQETERNETELHQQVGHLLSQGLKIENVAFDDAQRRGNPGPRPRPISVFFQWPSERNAVLRAAKEMKLKGIYINPNLPPTIRTKARLRRQQRPPTKARTSPVTQQ